jgi:hypothetical protein
LLLVFVRLRDLANLRLLDGTPDAHILGPAGLATLSPKRWTNDKGKEVLDYIRRNTGIFFDVSTDCLIYPNDNETSFGNVSVYYDKKILKTKTDALRVNTGR